MTPQKAHPFGETSHTTYRSLRSVHPFLHNSSFIQLPKHCALECFSIDHCSFTHGFLDPCTYTLPCACPNPHPKQQLDRFSRFCTACRRVTLYTLQCVAHFPLQSCPLAWEDFDFHLILDSSGQHESTTQTASRSVQPFLHSSRL